MNIETKVAELLNLYEETKDDDNYLFHKFIMEFKDEFEYDDMYDLYTIVNFISVNRLATLFSTLRRTRQKLQEHNEKYRGHKWYARQLKGEELKEFYANYYIN